MDTPIVRATLISGILNAISNVLGQIITCYQKNKPFTLSSTDLAQFVLFSILICPPNFMWQTWLEEKFPGYTEVPATRHTSANADHRESKDKVHPRSENSKQLNIRNTAAKFMLDQTVGAAVNTILFTGGIGLIKGRPVDVVINDCREQFWPIIYVGWRLWPVVSLVSFVMIPVEFRTTFGSIIGMLWGIYLSLLSNSDKS